MLHKGIIINEEDTNIDSVLVKADQEGNIFQRQGDDIIIMSPRMAEQFCANYSRYVAKTKAVIGQLLLGSLVFSFASMRLDLWEQGLYGVSIIHIMSQ